MREEVRKHLKSRLKTGGFILSLVGWFLLIVVPLEFAGFNLVGLENFIKTPTFAWGIKIFIVLILIFLIKGQKVIDTTIEKYRWLKFILKIIFGVGIIGWIVGLGSLFF